jgi:flagellin
MADQINLSSAVRSNLGGLQQTSRLGARTDERLGSGQAVNSPIDGAAEFFASRALSDRASGLSAAKDGIDQAISTVQAATNGLDAISDLAEQARGLATAARNTSDPDQRAALQDQFNEVTNQINGIAEDSGFGGTNLVGSSPDDLPIPLNEDGSSTDTVQGIDSSAAGLGFTTADFSSDAGIDAALGQASAAVDTVRTSSATLASNSSALQTRINFTEDLANTLEAGAAKLTEADLNEEAANRLSLQTRQALGNNALGLAAQSERAILGLFG